MNIKSLLAIVLASAVMTGCTEDDGGSGGGGGGNPDNSVPGRSTSHISVSASSKTVTGIGWKPPVSSYGYCNNATSVWETENFLIANDATGGSDSNTLKEIVKVAQASFDNHVDNNRLISGGSEIDADTKKITICVKASEGSNGAGYANGMIIGTGRQGLNRDKLFDHELVHTITDRLAGNYGIVTGNNIHGIRWFNEGVAERFSDGSQLNHSQMSGLISGSGSPIPSEVTEKGVEDIWMVKGKDTGLYYPSYNTVIGWLAWSEGWTTADMMQVYKNIAMLESLCVTERQKHFVAHPSSTHAMDTNNPIDYFVDQSACFYSLDAEDPMNTDIAGFVPEFVHSSPYIGDNGVGVPVYADNLTGIALELVLAEKASQSEMIYGGSENLGDYKATNALRDHGNFQTWIMNGYL